MQPGQAVSEKESCGDKQVKEEQGSNVGGAVEGQPGIWGYVEGGGEVTVVPSWELRPLFSSQP